MPLDTDALRAEIAAELDALVAIRHDLHAHPELGYQETRTSGVVQRELTAAGVSFVPGLAGGTGVVAHLPGGSERGIGLRADMDALPITEASNLPYKSQHDGLMHACGHDGHTTVLLGAMRVLAKRAEQAPLPRPVTFVFQPAEEGGAGGRRMVEDGCLDGSVLGAPVEQMYGLHGWPLLPVGTVGTRVGPLLAAADMFDITVRGTDAHAALPHLGADPIVAGSAIVTAAQSIVSRNVSPVDSVVVSITQFHGGTAHNIIPGEVRLQGTVRTLRKESQELAFRRLKEVAEGVARSHGCEAEVDVHYGYPVTSNHADAVRRFEEATGVFDDEGRRVPIEEPFMGGEDFSFYGQVVPACFFLLGLRDPTRTRTPNLHQNDFDFHDGAITTGVEAFVRLALGDSSN